MTDWRAAKKAGSLIGDDVDASCARCHGPIFNQSLNRKVTNGRQLDGSPRLRHLRCPRSGRASA